MVDEVSLEQQHNYWDNDGGRERERDIKKYIHTCAVQFWGVFSFIRSIMLPGMHSKMGRAASGARKPLFLQCFVELLPQVCKISGVVLGHHAENEALNEQS